MSWIFYFIKFFCFYVKEVVVANLHIAWDIITPGSNASPAFVEVDIDGLSELQVLIVANLITMTPGTLSFQVSPDRKRLLLHLLYLTGSAEQLAHSLEQKYVGAVRRLF